MLHILALPAEDDVDPVIKRSVLLWDGKPCLPAHDHHILLACNSEVKIKEKYLTLRYKQFLTHKKSHDSWTGRTEYEDTEEVEV